jgi:hypothetical protein
MTPRIFNVPAGIWLFVSAFVWPHGAGQLGYTAICGALTVLFAILTSYYGWARYLTISVGVLLFVLAFAASPWGSATFWNNAIIGVAVTIAAFVNGGSEAVRRERDVYGRIRT